MMKYLLLVATILCVKADLLTKEEVEKLEALNENCIKETSVDKALVKKALNGDYTDDPNLKAQILCFNKKLGFQNDSGDVLEEDLIKRLVSKFNNEKMVTSAVKHCSDKKASPEETAFELVKCLHSFAPKDFNIISLF